jgi:hypothetical protein
MERVILTENELHTLIECCITQVIQEGGFKNACVGAAMGAASLFGGNNAQAQDFSQGQNAQTEVVQDTLKQNTLQEPEFVYDGYIVDSNGQIVELTSEKVKMSTKASASMYLPMHIGTVKTRYVLNGPHSPSVVSSGKGLKIVFRYVSNRVKPSQFLQIYQAESTKKERRVLIGKMGTFTGVSTGIGQGLHYKAQRLGESSYCLSLANLEPGEYVINIGFTHFLSFRVAGEVKKPKQPYVSNFENYD